MNFKRKAGAAVLAIAAASAIAVPGVAMATTAVAVTANTAAEASESTFTGYYSNNAYFEGSLVGHFATVNSDGTETTDGTYVNLVTDTDDSDDIEGFLAAASTSSDIVDLTGLYIDNNEIDTLDLTDATMLKSLYVNAGDMTDLDGLDKVGTGRTDDTAEIPVIVNISAADLTSVDFGDNDTYLKVILDTDLNTLDMSGLDNLIYLDVKACGDLESLDLTDDSSLKYLDISGTSLATLDTSDTALTTSYYDADSEESSENEYKKGDLESIDTLYATGITLDDQYATETVNDDDDDLNDYSFDLDSITNGFAQRIASDDSETTSPVTGKANGTSFVVSFDSKEGTLEEDYIDYDDGELVITSEYAPTSIQYTVMTEKDDNTDVTYNVTFDVKTAGSRIAGSDRYDTMHELNTNEGDNDFDDTDMFGKSAGNIVVAAGSGYADALSSSALAGALNTGIVTTPVDSLTDDTIDMLDDMDSQKTAYIVGGTSAVSYAVEQQLTDLGFSIQRMAGTDRFDTAVKTQDKIQDLIDDTELAVDDNDTVIIASGVNYADALAIAPYAYNKNTPIVLVGADGTMDDTTAALFNKYKTDYSNAIVVGGTAVVSDDVIDTLEGYDMDVIRLAGADRFETNLVINDWLDRSTSSISSSDDVFEAAGYSSDDIDDFNDADIKADSSSDNFDSNTFDGTAYVVTGLNYADALAVAPLAGKHLGTINMVSDTDLTTITEAADNDATYKVVGGTSVISSDLFDAIEDLD